MSWTTFINFRAQVFVDVSGNALVLVDENKPMSMPCIDWSVLGFRVSESGSVSPFAPATPTYRMPNCSNLAFAGFGSALALDDGGVAFYRQPIPGAALSLSGWYARYPSSPGASATPPAWLRDHDGSLQRLAGGTAYLGTRRDPATCSRTAELVGPGGQVCATLALDGSAGCDAIDRITPDGTLVLRESASCSLRWWPGLGRAREH